MDAAHHGDEDSTTGVSEGGGGDGGCSTVAKITGVSSPSTCNLTFFELLVLGELKVLTCGRLMVLPAGSGSPGCSSLIEGLIKARRWSDSVCAIIRMEDHFWDSLAPSVALAFSHP